MKIAAVSLGLGRSRRRVRGRRFHSIMTPMLLRWVLGALVLTASASAQSDWNDPFPPHRIADNLYYVGSKDLATYLIATPEGHILINSNLEDSLPLIQKSVEKLGFKMILVELLISLAMPLLLRQTLAF